MKAAYDALLDSMANKGPRDLSWEDGSVSSGHRKPQKSNVSGLPGRGDWRGTLNCVVDGLDDSQKIYLRSLLDDVEPPQFVRQPAAHQSLEQPARTSLQVYDGRGGNVSPIMKHYHDNRDLLMGSPSVEMWAHMHFQHSYIRPAFQKWKDELEDEALARIYARRALNSMANTALRMAWNTWQAAILGGDIHPETIRQLGLRRSFSTWHRHSRRLCMVDQITEKAEARYALEMEELQRVIGRLQAELTVAQNEQHHQDDGQVDSLKAELQDMQQLEAAARAEKRDLELEIRELRIKQAQGDGGQEKLKKELSRATEESDSAKSKLRKLEGEAAKMREQIKQIDKLEGELKETRQDRRNAVADKKDMEIELRQLRVKQGNDEKNRHTAEEVAQLQQQLNKAESEVARLEALLLDEIDF